MPIRTSSLTKRISQNGQQLHRAREKRLEAQGAGDAPSAEEDALLAERAQLKQERAQREARAAAPRPTAVERLARTHHPEAKGGPKATKAAKDGGKDASKDTAKDVAKAPATTTDAKASATKAEAASAATPAKANTKDEKAKK